MRLIDADALEQKKRTGTIGNISGDFVAGFDIDTSPTIDAVPVVRCQECVHNHPEFVGNETQWCELCRTTINPDDFCSYGQRKIETVLLINDIKDESLEADHEVS